MDTSKHKETPEKKVANDKQAVESKKLEHKELHETQLDELSAGYDPKKVCEYFGKKPF